MMTDKYGYELWSRTYFSPGDEGIMEGQFSIDGGFTLYGFSDSESKGQADFLLIKGYFD